MAASKSKTVTRYYVRDSIVPFEEDHLHEFKGHRNLSVEELPPSTQANFRQEKSSRRACSRNINAFLNTGDGGTVYLGVLDDGMVKGFRLTQYQKDHVQTSLDDLMSRYSPPVARHRYRLHFIPIVDGHMTEEARLKHCAYESSLVDLSDQELRRRPHSLRISSFCWCDKDAAAQNSAGRISSSYVIEIHVKAWDKGDYRNVDGAVTDTTIHPIHEDEEGNAYFRRQASIVTYTMRELAQMTRQEVRQFYSPEISRLKTDIEKCLQKLKKQQTQV